MSHYVGKLFKQNIKVFASTPLLARFNTSKRRSRELMKSWCRGSKFKNARIDWDRRPAAYRLGSSSCEGSCQQTCCIFWPAFGCWALQMLSKMCVFNVFCAKKLKKCVTKVKICWNFLQKTIFLSLHQNSGGVFYSQKKISLKKNHVFTH